MNYQYAQQIIPRIWIGDVNSSVDKNFLLSNKINVIVNCTKDLPNMFEPFTILAVDPAVLDQYFIKYFRVSCDDNGRSEEVLNFYNETMRNINLVVEQYILNKNILIHCSAGQQRSCSFAVCLMSRLGFSKNDAFGKIVEKRPNSFNFGRQINFKEAIEQFC